MATEKKLEPNDVLLGVESNHKEKANRELTTVPKEFLDNLVGQVSDRIMREDWFKCKFYPIPPEDQQALSSAS